MITCNTGNTSQFKLSLEATGKLPSITLRCTGDSAEGVYLFGGTPVGFATSTSPKFPWFYKVGENAKGRCFVEYNTRSIESLTATTNQSAMVILDLQSAQ